jgi:hypothetical protein
MIDLFLEELRPLNLEKFKNFQFSGLFFAIFATIALKLGLLLCNKKLQFQFAFRHDWFIFAGVIPLELRKI